LGDEALAPRGEMDDNVEGGCIDSTNLNIIIEKTKKEMNVSKGTVSKQGFTNNIGIEQKKKIQKKSKLQNDNISYDRRARSECASL